MSGMVERKLGRIVEHSHKGLCVEFGHFWLGAGPIFEFSVIPTNDGVSLEMFPSGNCHFNHLSSLNNYIRRDQALFVKKWLHSPSSYVYMRHPYPSEKIPRDLQVAAMLTPLSCPCVDRYGKRRI
jgi:hypothetical protein